ncbi:hypothetical protein O1611_g9277 [Lasiodiplodia mahajangana]|uniref:Uncharacterized protein n=1 Tax=Lasiodiplodia mahajangana TaxID=1108764 RepID=A0ACC2JB24_9PEZI|nr:hypothetical protein O1611_g9277 [Lasiodiplodia mahajangana]
MALKPSLLQFLIWASSIPIASSNRIGLGGDIASLVPTCAQSCLLSFIKSNYPTTDCGTSFTLPCLCPVQSISGFTVGEAALQCLLGDLQLGQCGEQDVNDAAPARVLHMCSGQKSALPNTHATLTATLVIPASGAPITTSSRTTLRTSTTTPSLTTTSSSSVLTSSSISSFPVSTTTSTPASTTASTTASTSTPSTTSEPSTTARLAPAQIAGISVGVVGAIAVATGAILLARCMRRRRYPDVESEKGFFENNNSTASFDPSSSRGSRVFHISPPVLRTSKYRPDFGPRPPPPATQAVQPERPIQSANMDRNTIGLAISRPRSLIPQRLSLKLHSPAMSSPRPVEVPLERKPSKLLPPRPALTLEIPSKSVAASEPSSQGPPTKDRASTMTNMTAFADLDSEAAEGGLTWRPPSTDPLSATRLYVADKYGNWVLNNDNRRSQIAQVVEAAELDTYTPLTKSPIEKQEEAAQMAAAISASTALPQPAFLSRDPANWTNSQSSSLYSQASAAKQTGRRNSSSRNSASRYRKSNSGPMMNRSDSKASATTIQTSSTGGNDDGSIYDDIARLSQLSPVQESPAPVPGRARVTYPKIPGRLGGATIRYVPPPKRPDFTTLPSQQPSPTLGVYPIEGSPSAYPPPLNPRRSVRGFTPIQRTGSGFTPEPPNVEVFPLQSFARPNETSGSGPYPGPDSAPMQTMGSYRYADSQQQDPPRTPPQQSGPTFTPSPLSEEKKPPTPLKSRLIDRGRPSIASQRVASGTSFATVSSTTSSLLAKRLGSDRAAAFALDPNGERAQQWKRRGDGLLSPDLASPRGTLPQTPIWQPKLTPTRRGGDLYLNVQ